MTSLSRYDVVVIGGGILGSSTAYFLKAAHPNMSVCVIEPDPTYEFASALRASGGARRLFSCPENIEMSNFSLDCIRSFPETMAAMFCANLNRRTGHSLCRNKTPIGSQTLSPAMRGERSARIDRSTERHFANPSTGQIQQAFDAILGVSQQFYPTESR